MRFFHLFSSVDVEFQEGTSWCAKGLKPAILYGNPTLGTGHVHGPPGTAATWPSTLLVWISGAADSGALAASSAGGTGGLQASTVAPMARSTETPQGTRLTTVQQGTEIQAFGVSWQVILGLKRGLGQNG